MATDLGDFADRDLFPSSVRGAITGAKEALWREVVLRGLKIHGAVAFLALGHMRHEFYCALNAGLTGKTFSTQKYFSFW